ncbi:uncharacterized protein UTRI_06125_B [Ustilago trichophora]|uniref:Retrograde transport protein Dsl1 C-terminal domain-containing protein n=1 Tax=Ustilago trichophora TaxID=86804 RepID=A0A5C3EGS8_9BASI|nr:uncharacterized protein UTRI_06125_B [Ustilago trichophora]
MSFTTAQQDASLSAASFLASISAETSTSFGSSAPAATAASSAPALPISAKVSLIDAQIDALEGRIEQTITSHAAQLRERTASTRSVDHDLNQLWRSINQTSSRLVTVGPQLAPIASDYHDALAQSSKQGLLISVLSDLLAATRHLEKLEKLQHESDLSALRAELPKTTEIMQPFRSRSALQILPAVVELRARFDRLENKCKETDSASRSVDTVQATQQAPGRSSLGETAKDQKDTAGTDTAQALSPALKVLDTARALIVARGSEAGWKEVRIELDTPAPPPSAVLTAASATVQSSVDSNRSSLDIRPERLLREDLATESASLTRNSSSSSNINARNRHKPKLGARVIRPQDQLGSGPFNAEDTSLDEDGWGLDDDEEKPAVPAPAQATISSHLAHYGPHGSSGTSQPAHPSVSALARDSRHSSPSSSVLMQSSMSSSSSQRSAFAVQEPQPRAGASAAKGVDAWGLGEEDDKPEVEAEGDAWDLDEDDAPAASPPFPSKEKAHVPTWKERTDIHALPAAPAAPDAWGLEDEDVGASEDPWETQEEHKEVAPSPAASQEHLAATRSASPSIHNAAPVAEADPANKAEPSHPHTASAPTLNAPEDPWETEEQAEPAAAQSSVSQPRLAPHSSMSASKASGRPTTTLANNAEASQPTSSTAPTTIVDSDPWETDEHMEEPAPSVTSQVQEDAELPPPVLAICPPHPDFADAWGRDHQAGEAEAPVAASHARDAVPSSTQLTHAAGHISAPVLAKGTEESLSQAESVPTMAQEEPSHDSMEGLQQPVHNTEEANRVVHEKEASHQSKSLVDKTLLQAHQTEKVPQQAAQLAEDDLEVEPEEDAWGFEDGSSASEADRAEFAPITPLSKKEGLDKPIAAAVHGQSADVASTKLDTAKAPVGTADSALLLPKDIVAPSAHQSQSIASPPSPTGWGQDFSDSDSTGDPATSSVASNARLNERSMPSSRSVSVNSKARSGTPTRESVKVPDPSPEPAAVLKEECTISQRSLDLVKLAESTMDSVISLLRGQDHSGSSADDAEALAGAVFKIFELHRALMPVAHGEALRDVPSLAMQFFNDCEYLARELTRLIADKGAEISTAWISHDAEGAKQWKTKELPKLEQEAAQTRGLGQRWFEAQMAAQTKILLDTLMEADGFARTFDEHRFARCERCIKQVVQTLQQLAKAWEPVLVASRFQAAIGRLVDLVFQKVLHDVLDLEDIGESESEKIASLVKTLGSLERLFSAEGDAGQSSAPLWVPSWFKTSYLIEILTGSLVDIEFLAFEAGALVDYSRKELTRLIRALFADTPNRSKLLRRIESAPVDVLAH